MLHKIRAWLLAKLYLKVDFTIPETAIRFSVVMNRITGKGEVSWKIPDYMRAVEQHRLQGQKQVQITIMPQGSEPTRRAKATLN